ncbi:probable glutamate carboxypeptidase VP8 isoform X2 [Elaeis guineensis]|uniref:Probable glutamate carboxypeptidase VP8 isoform X2 n=1 Tax=Elaeis guineensis var. tenera TaxID=51953 RepID=A0A6I9QG03_ELAGV|nr:probable glutamate carboxypeptidase VP8 isoform X2 [Elaeis guineensis]
MRSSHSPRPYNPHSFSSLRASPSLILLALLLFLLFYSLRRPTPPSRNALAHSPTAPAALFLSLSPSANSTIASHLRNLTLRPHLAGTPSAATAATYVLSRLRGAGLRTFTRDYTPLLSYPAAASLALLRPDGALLKPLSLAEPADPTAAAVPPYHAYAPSGATLAPAVYVNYGREEDYLALDRLGVRLRGCVAIARRGEGYRGGVVARAAERGAAAMLIFRDSGGGVERGMVRLGGVGDPLTPGWATTASAGGGRGERLGADDEEVRRRFPKIPSMPVSAAVAVEILRTLGGPRVPPKWRSALSQDETGVGPGPTLVNFTYKIGSTEWVEQNLGILSSKAVVYLNVDCAVQGPGFFAGATPQLDKLLVEVTKEIKDPDLEGKTVYHTWVAMNSGIIIERLARTDSDFSAFLHHAGVPVIDLYYGKEFSGYHTALDTYDWMEKHGDPMFHRHVAIAEIWGLLGLHLADDPVLPFDYLSYAARLQEHTNELSAFLNGGEFLQPVNASIRELTVAANEASEEGKRLQEQETMEHFAALKRRAFNDRLMLTERSFLEAEGLKRRGWFKHLLYSPPEDYESNVSFFPGIVDAIAQARKFAEGEGQLGIQHEIWRVARAIQRAASVLRGELT